MQKRGSQGPIIVGVILLLVGVFTLLGQFIELPDVIGWILPVLAIGAGFYFLIRHPRSAVWWAPWPIVFGTGWLLMTLGVITEDDVERLWPIALVLVGGGVLAAALFGRGRRSARGGEQGDGYETQPSDGATMAGRVGDRPGWRPVPRESDAGATHEVGGSGGSGGSGDSGGSRGNSQPPRQ